MSSAAARTVLGLSVLALAAGVSSAKSPPTDRLGVVDTLIHEIQGDGLVSPLLGTRVTTEGVVTAVVGNGYFLQALPGQEDTDATTSQGLFVFTGTADPAVAVGQQREVEGRVEEATVGDSPHQLTLTRLVDTQSLLLASGLPLPEPIVLTAQDLSPSADVDALERYEGMRVSVARLVVMGATGASIDPVSLTAASDGVFHAIWGQTLGIDAEPPLREPGLSLLDAGTPPAGKNLALHDANPEVLRVDSRAQPGTALLDVAKNDRLRDAVGVLGYQDARYSLLLDPVSPLVVELRPRSSPAAPSPVERRMAWVDLDRLFDASDDPGRSEPVPSASGYQARLVKVADSLCRALANPEVIAVNGAENLQVLLQLAATIDSNPSTFCPEPRQYQALMIEGSDPDGLDIGFLVAGAVVDGVNPRVTVLDLDIVGTDETSAHPAGGTEPLFTTPPLVARLRMTSGDGRPFLFTAVNVRFHPLDGADSLAPGSDGWATQGERIMTLRARQAASLAAWLEAHQQANPGEALAVFGGFDADAFNDGRVDVMGIVTGNAAPADQSWVSLPSALGTPLSNLTLRMAPWFQYNANERGDFRALDHILVNEAMLQAVGFAGSAPRLNTDFPAVERVAIGGRNYAFSPRDPRVARMSVKSFIDADTRVEMSLPETINPNGSGTYPLAVANAGPDFAPLLLLEVLSSLPPEQWGVSASWPGWACGETATDPASGGSRATCRHDGLRDVEYNHFQLYIGAHPQLQGTSADFTATVTGAHGDPDLSNNQRSATINFDSLADVYVELTPLGAAGDVLPGTSSGWTVAVKQAPLGSAGQLALVIDIDAAPGEVTLGPGAAGLGCDAGTATAPRRSRFSCSFWGGESPDIATFDLRFSTRIDDGGRSVGITVEAATVVADAAPDNDSASAVRTVSDAVDLRVTAPTGSPAVVGSPASVYFVVGNFRAAPARNARLEILLDIAPNAIQGVESQPGRDLPDIWSCLAPQAEGDGARIECIASAPVVRPDFPPDAYAFLVHFTPPLRPGLPNYRVTTRVTASSDSDEQAPADNTVQGDVLVGQSADVEAVLDEIYWPVVEPRVAEFRIGAFVASGPEPQQARARLEFDAEFGPGEVQVRTYEGVAVACLPSAAPAGRYALDCPLGPTNNVRVYVQTRPDLVDAPLGVTLTITSELNELEPRNNVATGSVNVASEFDLCVGVICTQQPVPVNDPYSLIQGQNTLEFSYVNRGESTARDAVATLEIALPASAVAARAQGQACEAAEAIGTSHSRIRCALGDLPGWTGPRVLSLDADATGFTGAGVDVSVVLSGVGGDTQPSNNRLAKNLALVPVIDLSAIVQAKSASYPNHAEFALTLGVEGEGLAPASELQLDVDIGAPLPANSVEIRSQGWICGPVTSGMVQRHTFHCERVWPIPAGSASRMTVRVPTDQFRQIGRAVEVSAVHRFPRLALGTDLETDNNIGIARIVVDGRKTQSTRPATEPTPAYGVRRAITPTPLRPNSRATARD